MLLSHDKDFTEFRPATTEHLPELALPATDATTPGLPPRYEIDAFTAGTMVETEAGWRVVDSLKAGDRVATLDGGVAEVKSVVSRPAPSTCRLWHIPAGSLNNCSDLRLASGQHVALTDPEVETLFDTHCVLVPVAAMAGFRGIQPLTCFDLAPMTRLEFDTEEIVFTQTGTLVHVPTPSADPFFRTLAYGETRALLSLINGGHCAPDAQGFAPAQAA